MPGVAPLRGVATTMNTKSCLFSIACWITGSAGASSLISICAWVVVVTPAAIGCAWPTSATPGLVSRTAPAGPA